jgi:hypothetical protein
MPNTPNRSTSEAQLNQWNQQLRASPIWQSWWHAHGKDRPGAGLSDSERQAFTWYLKQNGIQIPSGMHIDQGGNLNQDNHLLRNVGIGAAIGGAALTGLGAAGIGPLSGALSGGAAAGGAGAAGGTLASSSLPAASLMGGPGAISSMGASAGLGGGLLAGSSIPAAMGSIGGPAAIASQGASRGIPWGGAANAAEDYLGSRPRSGVGRALGAAGDEASRWSPLLQSAISALAGLPALLTNHGPSAEERALYDQARQMQALQQKRIEHQSPLFEAVTRLAMGRLPSSVQGQIQPLVGAGA